MRGTRKERWEQRERGDCDLERFDRVFQERLSEKGREILRQWREKTGKEAGKPNR